MELEKTYSFRVDTGSLNENKTLTLSALQRIIVTVSEEHLENIGLDVPKLMKEFGVSWILLSMSVDIKSPIRDGERLSVRTWHTEKKGVYFRREIEVCHPDGTVAAVAATFSSIFDMKTPNGAKKVVYNELDIPCIAVEDLAELGKTDPLYAELAELAAANGGRWSPEAEKVLLENIINTLSGKEEEK